MLLPLGPLVGLVALAAALPPKVPLPAKCVWRSEPESTRSGHIECGGLESPCMGEDVRYLPDSDENGHAYLTCGIRSKPCPFYKEPPPDFIAVPTNPDTSKWPSCRLTSESDLIWFNTDYNTDPPLGLHSRDPKKHPNFLDWAVTQADKIEEHLDRLDDGMVSSQLPVDPTDLNEFDPTKGIKPLGQWKRQYGGGPGARLPDILNWASKPADELEDKYSEHLPFEFDPADAGFGDTWAPKNEKREQQDHRATRTKRADLFKTLEIMGDNWRYDDQPGHPAVSHLPFVFDPAADGFGDEITTNTPRPNGSGGL